jgi:hypothetical protein
MRSRFARRVTIAFGALALVAPSTASADIIFSNLGPGNSYNTSSGNPVGFDFFSGDQDAQADSFFPLIDATLSSVSIALKSFSGTNAFPVTISLTSSAGGLPGAVLESWIIPPGTLQAFGSSGNLAVLTSVLHPALSIGGQYWVTAFGGAGDPLVWNLSNVADPNPTATSVNGGATWNRLGLTPGALRVEGTATAVPEPATLVLTATVMFGIAACTRRRTNTRTSAPSNGHDVRCG